MSNFFDEDVAAPQNGNAFDDTLASVPVDDKEQDVIHRTNNPLVETPSSFGLTEIPVEISKGFAAEMLSAPQMVGSTLVEAGELSQGMQGKSFADVAKQSFARRLAENIKEGEESPGLFSAVKVLMGSEKDALLSLFSDGSAPKVMANAGNAMIEQNQAAITALGLTPKGGSNVAFDIGGGFSSIAKTIGITAVTKNPAWAAGYMTWLTNSGDYIEARKAGKPPETAAQIAGASAAGQGLIELLGGRVFLHAAAGSSFLKKVILRASGQSAEEGTQAAVEEGVKGVTGVRNKTPEEIAMSIGYQAMIGFIVGAPVSTIVTKIEDMGKKAGLPDDKINELSDNLVRNKDEIIDAATIIIDKETAGVKNDEPARAEALKAVKQVFSDKSAEEDAMVKGGTQDPQIAAKIILKSPQYTDEQKANVRQAMDGELTMESLQRAVALEVRSSIDDAYIKKINPDGKRVEDSARPNYGQGDMMGMRKRDSTLVSKHNIGEGEVSIYRNKDGSLVATAKGFKQLIEPNEEVGFIAALGKDTELGVVEEFRGLGIAKLLKRQQIIDNPNTLSGGLTAGGESVARSAIKELQAENKIPESLAKELVPSGGNLPPIPPDKADFYNGFLSAPKRKKEGVSVGDAIGKALSPISTRLRNINPKLEAKLRKFEQAKNLRVNESQRAALPFLEAYSKLPTNERLIFNAALMNGDTDIINQIAAKHKIDMQPLRDMLDGLYKRAKSVGLDIGYRENYFPRTVIDSRGLLGYFEKTEAWSEIKEALRIKELEVGRMLTVDEKAHMINTLLRGYQTSQITLSKPSALKERNIDKVTPEIIGFYDTSDQSILKYITSVNEAIEVRKFFGKGETTADSIGAFVLGEIESGRLNAQQAEELSDILRARFTDKAMNPILKAYKNISYIDTMGSFISAITQIGDISWSLANNGVYNTLSTLPKAISGKTEVTLEDIGIEGIAQEFMDSGMTGNAVRKVFKIVGLQKMDTIGKLTYIEGALKRLRAGAVKPTPKFTKALNDIFGDETGRVIEDLKNGVNSENVKMLLFNELSNVQPISLAEMPEMYLKHPNGRIFYMLKTFTIKQLDIYRRQIFNEIRDGDAKTGLKNLVRLAFFMSLMNTGADYLKDLLLNRDTPPEDEVVNNIARLAGFSKYQIYSVRREGLGTAAFKTIAPPFKLVDGMSRDIIKLSTKDDVDINDLKTIDSVPIAGKFYYWWFGAGAEKDKRTKSFSAAP